MTTTFCFFFSLSIFFNNKIFVLFHVNTFFSYLRLKKN